MLNATASAAPDQKKSEPTTKKADATTNDKGSAATKRKLVDQQSAAAAPSTGTVTAATAAKPKTKAASAATASAATTAKPQTKSAAVPAPAQQGAAKKPRSDKEEAKSKSKGKPETDPDATQSDESDDESGTTYEKATDQQTKDLLATADTKLANFDKKSLQGHKQLAGVNLKSLKTTSFFCKAGYKSKIPAYTKFLAPIGLAGEFEAIEGDTKAATKALVMRYKKEKQPNKKQGDKKLADNYGYRITLEPYNRWRTLFEHVQAFTHTQVIAVRAGALVALSASQLAAHVKENVPDAELPTVIRQAKNFASDFRDSGNTEDDVMTRAQSHLDKAVKHFKTFYTESHLGKQRKTDGVIEGAFDFKAKRTSTGHQQNGEMLISPYGLLDETLTLIKQLSYTKAVVKTAGDKKASAAAAASASGSGSAAASATLTPSEIQEIVNKKKRSLKTIELQTIVNKINNWPHLILNCKVVFTKSNAAKQFAESLKELLDMFDTRLAGFFIPKQRESEFGGKTVIPFDPEKHELLVEILEDLRGKVTVKTTVDDQKLQLPNLPAPLQAKLDLKLPGNDDAIRNARRWFVDCRVNDYVATKYLHVPHLQALITQLGPEFATYVGKIDTDTTDIEYPHCRVHIEHHTNLLVLLNAIYTWSPKSSAAAGGAAMDDSDEVPLSILRARHSEAAAASTQSQPQNQAQAKDTVVVPSAAPTAVAASADPNFSKWLSMAAGAAAPTVAPTSLRTATYPTSTTLPSGVAALTGSSLSKAFGTASAATKPMAELSTTEPAKPVASTAPSMAQKA